MAGRPMDPDWWLQLDDGERIILPSSFSGGSPELELVTGAFEAAGIPFRLDAQSQTTLPTFGRARYERLFDPVDHLLIYVIWIRVVDAPKAAWILFRFSGHAEDEPPVDGPCPACGTLLEAALSCPSCGLSFRTPVDPEDPLWAFLDRYPPEEP